MPRWRRAYLCVDHEAQHVGDVVEGENAVLSGGPQPLPIRVALLYHSPHAVDHLVVHDGDLQVRALLVALVAQDVLAHRHLHRVDDGRVLIELLLALALEIRLVRAAVVWPEANRSSHVEVVHEAGHVEED
jgi:hypothetical protein